MNKDILLLFIKGIPFGISNVLPGISGGTIAVVLRIYDILINAIKDFNLKILLPMGIGAIFGLISTASLVNYLLDAYPSFMTALIFGLIVASVKATIIDIKKLTWINLLCLIIGFTIAFTLGNQSLSTITSDTIVNASKLIFSGVFASVSMLLPGISGATILVMLGMYEYLLQALLTINIKVILVFVTSFLVGILAFAWILSYLLANYRSELMTLITGLILGSSLVVMPKSLAFMDVLGMTLGIFIVLFLSFISKD